MVFLIIFILVVISVLKVNFFIVEVVGSSMEPAFEDGSYLLASRFFPKLWIKRGQIIVCRFFSASAIQLNYIVKRVKVCPYETIDLSEYKLISLNGILLTSDTDLHLPKDTYILKGDGKSSHILWGPVNKKLIVGTVLFKVR